MELRHLRYFLTVADTRHFGQAAERLHIAQSALSQAIRQLEKELGVTLFERTTRQVRLTPAGEFLQAESERNLGSIEASVRGVQRMADGQRGLVRLALTGTAAFTILPQVARVVRQKLPDIALEIHADLLTPQQSEGLVEGSLDLGILRHPISSDLLQSRPIESEPLILAAPADHRLAAEPMIALSDLRTESFVMYASDHSAVNSAVRNCCESAGFAPQVQHTAPSTPVLLALVAAGLGISLVPASARAIPLAGVVFRDVEGSGTIDLALAWRLGEDSPAVLNVIDVLIDAGIAHSEDQTQVRGTERRG